MPLSDTAIRAAKPRDKAYKMADGGGLTLLVKPTGSKIWRMRYRFGGIEKMLSFGLYPDVPVKLARERRDEARRKLAQKEDPGAERKAERDARGNTLRVLAVEWFELQSNPPESSGRAALTPVTAKKTKWMLEAFLYPKLGDIWINDITAARLYDVLREIESRGIRETAHRARSLASRIFRFAVATGRAERDITVDLRGALAPIVTKNRAAIIEPRAIGKLLRAIDDYDGQPATGIALKMAPYVFVRPGELRGARWNEIDWNAREWRIPADRMKMREQHVVPLSHQVITLLETLRMLTEHTGFLFPSLRSTERPISNNTINAALRRLGYSTDEMTGHGFRALASTRLNEQGWHPDLIELQLAHTERNRVRAAYNRAQRLDDRRKMMQQWADYLDELRSGVLDTVALQRQSPNIPQTKSRT